MLEISCAHKDALVTFTCQNISSKAIEVTCAALGVTVKCQKCHYYQLPNAFYAVLPQQDTTLIFQCTYVIIAVKNNMTQ